MGLSESLLRGEPPLAGQAAGLAQALHDEALRMSTLVTNLLDMARIESGQVRFNLDWQALEEVVGAALRASGAALRHHHVSVRLQHNVPLLRFDAVLVERVLCNLLENAAKYSPPGSPIEISVEARAADVEVAVCDHGAGFSGSRNSALFEMFVRGATESSLPGVGLGLAICRAIVEAHQGAISAANREGGGACVRFTLPLGNPPAIEDELAAVDALQTGSAS